MADDCWAVVELMGHVRVAGRLSEEEKFGSKLGRLDIPAEGGGFVTQYFGGGSVYRITVVSEEAARAVAGHNKPNPVQAWEMPKQPQQALPAGPAVYAEVDEWADPAAGWGEGCNGPESNEGGGH